MKRFAVAFGFRWLACSLGLWLAAALLGSHISYGGTIGAIVGAGLLLAILNTLLKPVLIILSLPAVILTLGLFMLVINGLTVYLVSLLYAPLHVANFWTAIFAGIIISLVNYVISAIR
jgi:putative membrane protein